MIDVTQDFKDASREFIKVVSGYLVLDDGTELLPSEDLQSFTINSVGGFLRSSMSKITISMLGDHNFKGQSVDAYYGVEYDGEMHYALVGKFNLTDVAFKKDKGVTEIIGYDNMMHFQEPYISVGEYPTTLFNYIESVCSLAGVPLKNDLVYNGSLSVEEDYYAGVEEITIREVLDDICEVTASHAIITPDGELELRRISDSGEVFTYQDLKNYTLEDYWGGVNSLVLSRQPQNDDVYVQNETAINAPTTRNVLDLSKFRVNYSVEEA